MNKIVNSAALLLCASSAANVAAAKPSTDEQQPNFVLFLADDCTHTDIGCYGSVNSITPNIDAFARDAMRFTEGYEAAPISSPTRHNLYTGIWPVKSGAYPNHTYAKEGTQSIVQNLQAVGYKVGLVGKSHIASNEVFPFDMYIPGNPANGELDQSAINEFMRLCRKAGDPFCLIVASNQPHNPWTLGDRSLFDAEKLVLPESFVDTPATRDAMVEYLAEVNYMDQEFGYVVASLKEHRLYNKSVILFLSEQGASFPSAKYTCYDAGVHSAFIMRVPGVTKAGSESDAIVEYCDVVPTFVDIAGADLLAPVDGESFLPVLKGERDDHKKYTYSMVTASGLYGCRGIYDGRYRFVLNTTPDKTFGCAIVHSKMYEEWVETAKTDERAKFLTQRYRHRPVYEFYDVHNDKCCLNNLIDDPKYSDKIAELKAELLAWMEECGDQGGATDAAGKSHTRTAAGLAPLEGRSFKSIKYVSAPKRKHH